MKARNNYLLTVAVVLFTVILMLSLLQSVEAQVYADIGYEDIAVDPHEGFLPAPALEETACTATPDWRICIAKFMRMRLEGVALIPVVAEKGP